jgi:hypothetical protein
LLSPREALPSYCPRLNKPGHNLFFYILPGSVSASFSLHRLRALSISTSCFLFGVVAARLPASLKTR